MTVLVMPPPEAITAMMEDPRPALEAAVMVREVTPEPGAEILAEEKAAVTPEGRALVERVTSELNPPTVSTVYLTVACADCTTAKLVAAAVRENPGMLTFTVTDLAMPPPFAVTTME